MTDHDPAIAHYERARSQLVNLVSGLRRPQDVAIVALGGLCLRLLKVSELSKQRLEESFDPIDASERSRGREQDGNPAHSPIGRL